MIISKSISIFLITVKRFLFCCVVATVTAMASAAELWVEAESFENKGGWVVDQQFTDLMGSSYLMAHGLGSPVADAETTISIPETGRYNVYIRTYNWTSPWHDGEGPGKFTIKIGRHKLGKTLGADGSAWGWQ